MGGGASILATQRDTRIRALANMAAAETNPSAIAAIAGVFVPVCLIAGDEDSIVPPSGHTIPMYDNALAPRRLPLLDGGWHCGFLDSSFFGCDSGSLPRATQLALTRGLLTGFFNLYLKNDQAVWRPVWGTGVLLGATDQQHAPGSGDSAGSQSGQLAWVRRAGGPGRVPADQRRPATHQLHAACGGQHVAHDADARADDDAQPWRVDGRERHGGDRRGPGNRADTALLSARSDLDGGTRAYATLTTERRLHGDLNGDGVVNGADFTAFAGCLSGPDVGILTGCNDADLDLDADVDLANFAVFQLEFGTGM